MRGGRRDNQTGTVDRLAHRQEDDGRRGRKDRHMGKLAEAAGVGIVFGARRIPAVSGSGMGGCPGQRRGVLGGRDPSAQENRQRQNMENTSHVVRTRGGI